VRTTEALLERAGTRRGRQELAEKAGVDTVAELAKRNAANLAAAVAKLVGSGTNIVRRLPTELEIGGWIEQAMALPRAVEY